MKADAAAAMSQAVALFDQQRSPCSEEDHPISLEEAERLFSRPFYFENIYAAWREAYMERLTSVPLEERAIWRNYINSRYVVTPEEGRAKIYSTMMETYMKGLHEGLALPELMLPEEDGAPRPLSQARRLRKGVL